jgi:putative peptidoglycan lipid II flippase
MQPVRHGGGRAQVTMSPAPVPAAHDPRRAIGQAVLVILSLTLVDKFLALGKEMLVAARYGVSPTLDVFNLAYAIPGLIGLLFDGAVVSAFVPLYADWRRRQPEREIRDRSLTVGVACLSASLFVAALGYVLAGRVFPLVGYGFTAGQTALGVPMLRLLLVLVVLEGTSALLASLLRAWKAFAAVTAAQLPINAALIAFLAWGRPGDIQLLVLGTLVGTAAKTVWLLVAVGRDMPLLAPFRFDRGALAAFMTLALPLAGSALIANSNILVDQSMATQLSPGGVSTLRYAYRINDLPLQIIVLALSKAILPFISEQVSAGDTAGIRRIFSQSLASLGLIAFPVIALVMLCADDIVSVLLRRGAFDAAAARETALALRCYTGGLFFYAYACINGAFFSALRRARALFVMGLVSLGLNFGFNVLFLRLTGGPDGIALSSSVTGAVLTIAFLLQLRGPLGLTRPLRLVIGLVPSAVATLAATLPCLLLHRTLAALPGPTLVRLGLEGGLFCAVFVPILVLGTTRVAEEFQPIWNITGVFRAFGRKIGGRKGK